MLCNNSEVSGPIQYHPSFLALVTGINTDVVIVQMTDQTVDKKLTKLQRLPLAFSGVFHAGPSICDVPGACVCVSCMPSWYIWWIHFISWQDIAGFHRLCFNCFMHSGQITLSCNNCTVLCMRWKKQMRSDAVRSAASSYAAMPMLAGSCPFLVIAWEWHIGPALLCGCSGALEYPTTNSCGAINKSYPILSYPKCRAQIDHKEVGNFCTFVERKLHWLTIISTAATLQTLP